MEPPWLVLDTTRLRPALDIDTDPVDRVRSAEHAHVVPDVPRRPRRAVCEARGWGETPCKRHVSPRNPIRFETTVDTSALAAISPHAATSRAGPIGSSSFPRERRHHPHHCRSHRSTPCPWDNGWYIVQPRPCLRRASGRAAITAACPPPNPRPHSPPAGPTGEEVRDIGWRRSRAVVIRRGNATTQLPHTQCIFGLLSRRRLLYRVARVAARASTTLRHRTVHLAPGPCCAPWSQASVRRWVRERERPEDSARQQEGSLRRHSRLLGAARLLGWPGADQYPSGDRNHRCHRGPDAKRCTPIRHTGSGHD